MRSIALFVLAACAAAAPSKPIEVPVVSAPNDEALRVSEAARSRAEAQIPKLMAENERLAGRVKELEEARAEIDEHRQGEISLADATAGLAGTGALLATIKTSMGDVSCKLFSERAPIAVATFVGLARGTRTWKDPVTMLWLNRPAYTNTTFHRVIKGFMIQGGDPKGDGTGEGGFVFRDEVWPGAKHDRAGLLCTANRGPNTNGIQFFITDAASSHLDSGYTIFGECSPVATVHAIAAVKTGTRDVPLTPVTIRTIEITRASGSTKTP